MSNTQGEIPFLAQLREQILRSPGVTKASGPKVTQRPRRRAALALVVAGVALTAVVLADSLLDGDPVTGFNGNRPGPEFGLSSDHPLLDGEQVPSSVALSELERRCEACLDRSSLPEIETAYLDSAGGVGFVLRDGTWVVLTPDGRTSATYVDDVKPLLSEPESPFQLIDLRGVQALSADQSQFGSAGLTWVEEGYLFEVIGPPGARTPSVVTLAESL